MSRIEPADLLRLALGTFEGHRLRTALSMLGIAIGVAAVILLTSLGEGARRYMVDQFSQFGTNVLSVQPGKTETRGMPSALFGSTQKLTIDDAEALARAPILRAVVPVAVGQARVEGNGRGRSVIVYGTTDGFPALMRNPVAKGEFLPGAIRAAVPRSPCSARSSRPSSSASRARSARPCASPARACA